MKLFSSILDSSVWAEPVVVRVVWVSLLAMADRDGFVRSSPSGLARRANVDLAACREAIRVLESPDVESSNQEWGGRRIEAIEGGWLILNYAHYRDLADAEVRREQVRAAVRRHRAKATSEVITGNHSQAHTDTEAATEATPSPKTPGPSAFDLAWQGYPKRAGSNSKARALKAWNARLADGATVEELGQGVARYARFCKAAGKVGTEYVMQAARFFGPAKEYAEAWDAPPKTRGRHEGDARYRDPEPTRETPDPRAQAMRLGEIMRKIAAEPPPPEEQTP